MGEESMKPGDKVWTKDDRNKWILVVILHKEEDKRYLVKVVHKSHPWQNRKLVVTGGELAKKVPPGAMKWEPPQPLATPENPMGFGCPHCGALPPTWQPDNKKCDGCGFSYNEANMNFKFWLGEQK
jgi:hypothetical protein